MPQDPNATAPRAESRWRTRLRSVSMYMQRESGPPNADRLEKRLNEIVAEAGGTSPINGTQLKSIMDRVVAGSDEKRLSSRPGPLDDRLYSHLDATDRVAAQQVHSDLEMKISKAVYASGIKGVKLKELSSGLINQSSERDRVNLTNQLTSYVGGNPSIEGTHINLSYLRPMMDRVANRADSGDVSSSAGPFNEQLYAHFHEEERGKFLEVHATIEKQLNSAVISSGIRGEDLQHINKNVLETTLEKDTSYLTNRYAAIIDEHSRIYPGALTQEEVKGVVDNIRDNWNEKHMQEQLRSANIRLADGSGPYEQGARSQAVRSGGFESRAEEARLYLQQNLEHSLVRISPSIASMHTNTLERVGDSGLALANYRTAMREINERAADRSAAPAHDLHSRDFMVVSVPAVPHSDIAGTVRSNARIGAGREEPPPPAYRERAEEHAPTPRTRNEGADLAAERRRYMANQRDVISPPPDYSMSVSRVPTPPVPPIPESARTNIQRPDNDLDVEGRRFRNAGGKMLQTEKIVRHDSVASRTELSSRVRDRSADRGR